MSFPEGGRGMACLTCDGVVFLFLFLVVERYFRVRALLSNFDL